jgi:hypothetical protein
VSGLPEAVAPKQKPDIRVMCVMGMADGEPDFVYTVGLQHLGHAELLMTGWPRSGSEDEPDWHLSRSDIVGYMSELVEEVTRGRQLEAGCRWTHQVDGGRTTLRFSTRPVGEDDVAQPLMLLADAHVLVLVFDLDRESPGEFVWPDEAALELVQARLDEWALSCEVILECDMPSVRLDPQRDHRESMGLHAPALAAVLQAAAELPLQIFYDWDMYLAQGGAHAARLESQLVDAARACGRQGSVSAILDAAADAARSLTECIDETDDRYDVRDSVARVLGASLLAWHLVDVLDDLRFTQATGLFDGVVGLEMPGDPAVEAYALACAQWLQHGSPSPELARTLEDRSTEIVQAACLLGYNALISGRGAVWEWHAPDFAGYRDSDCAATLWALHLGMTASLGLEHTPAAEVIRRAADELQPDFGPVPEGPAGEGAR